MFRSIKIIPRPQEFYRAGIALPVLNFLEPPLNAEIGKVFGLAVNFGYNYMYEFLKNSINSLRDNCDINFVIRLVLCDMAKSKSATHILAGVITSVLRLPEFFYLITLSFHLKMKNVLKFLIKQMVCISFIYIIINTCNWCRIIS